MSARVQVIAVAALVAALAASVSLHIVNSHDQSSITTQVRIEARKVGNYMEFGLSRWNGEEWGERSLPTSHRLNYRTANEGNWYRSTPVVLRIDIRENCIAPVGSMETEFQCGGFREVVERKWVSYGEGFHNVVVYGTDVTEGKLMHYVIFGGVTDSTLNRYSAIQFSCDANAPNPEVVTKVVFFNDLWRSEQGGQATPEPIGMWKRDGARYKTSSQNNPWVSDSRMSVVGFNNPGDRARLVIEPSNELFDKFDGLNYFAFRVPSQLVGQYMHAEFKDLRLRWGFETREHLRQCGEY